MKCLVQSQEIGPFSTGVEGLSWKYGVNCLEDSLETSYKHQGKFRDLCSVPREK